MNCHDIVAMLDGHRSSNLRPAEQATVDQHLSTCASCRAHWRAARVLASQYVPAVPPALLERTRRLLTAAGGAPDPASVPIRPRYGFGSSRSVRRLALGGSVLAAGAALAGVGVLLQREPPAKPQVIAEAPDQMSAEAADQSASDAGRASTLSRPEGALPLDTPASEQAGVAAGAPLRGGTAGEDRRVFFPDGDYFALLKVAPRYPVEAAEQGLEGSVVVEFVVTESGDVADVEVVESTDAVLESAAVSAAEQFKYMPRVQDGRPVAVTGVRNKITFVLQNPQQAKSPAIRNQAITGEPDPSMRPQFWQILAPAFEHVEAGDLLRAELVLDEARATYDLNPEESRALAKFYGFIYARLDDYERAIAAYESAAAIPGGWGNDTTLLTIASLHFKRQRYAEALESAQRYIELSDNPSPGAYQFVETLRQLGIAVDDAL